MLERAILDKEETPSEHASSGGIDDDEKQDRGPADVIHRHGEELTLCVVRRLDNYFLWLCRLAKLVD